MDTRSPFPTGKPTHRSERFPQPLLNQTPTPALRSVNLCRARPAPQLFRVREHGQHGQRRERPRRDTRRRRPRLRARFSPSVRVPSQRGVSIFPRIRPARPESAMGSRSTARGRRRTSCVARRRLSDAVDPRPHRPVLRRATRSAQSDSLYPKCRPRTTLRVLDRVSSHTVFPRLPLHQKPPSKLPALLGIRPLGFPDPRARFCRGPSRHGRAYELA
jgi:hypothetical protein